MSYGFASKTKTLRWGLAAFLFSAAVVLGLLAPGMRKGFAAAAAATSTLVLLTVVGVLAWFLVAARNQNATNWARAAALAFLVAALALLAAAAWRKSPIDTALLLACEAAAAGLLLVVATAIQDAAQPNRMAVLGACLLLAAALFACAFQWTGFKGATLLRWALLAPATLVLAILLGWWGTGTWKGIFIGPANTWSLSITQAVLWTCIVLSALIAVWVARLHDKASGLDIPLDPRLLLVMGLPVGTVALSSGILALKTRATPTPGRNEMGFVTSYLPHLWEDHQRSLGNPGATVPDNVKAAFAGTAGPILGLDDAAQKAKTLAKQTAEAGKRPADDAEVKAFVDYARKYLRQATHGRVVGNLLPSEALFSDLMRGEDAGNANSTNFGKVQFLLLSAVAILVYCITLAGILYAATGTCSDNCPPLPGLQGTFPALMLASAGTYLGTKALPG